MAVVAEVSRVDDNIFVGGPTRTLTALTSTVVSLPSLTSPFVRWLGGTEVAFISWLPCYTSGSGCLKGGKRYPPDKSLSSG